MDRSRTCECDVFSDHARGSALHVWLHRAQSHFGGLVSQRPTPLKDALVHVEADAPEELLIALRSIPDDTNPDTLRASGYVIDTLQTSLYHGLTADTAEEAIVSAVNMGEDTDTVGAVTGAIAGARFGADALPDRWIGELECADEIERLESVLMTAEFR